VCMRACATFFDVNDTYHMHTMADQS